jgi:hypothetical protein
MNVLVRGEKPMKDKSGVSSTAHHQPGSSNSTKAEPASIGDGGFSLQSPPGGDKSFAAQPSSLPPSLKDYSWAAFCPFTAGHYTEF